VERFTNCWPTPFTSARSGTSRNAIRGSTKRLSSVSYGSECSSGCARMRLAAPKPSTKSIASPLAGKIFDADGQPLYVQGAAKAGRRYRYYVSRSLVIGSANDDGKGWRLSALEIERAVAIAARQILNDRAGLLEALEKSEIDSPDVRATLESTSSLSRRLEVETDATECIVELVDRVELRDDGISVTLKIQVHCSRAGVRTSSTLNLSRFVPLRMKRRGVETRIVIAAGGDWPAPQLTRIHK
jgi:site-specific DNA recombinase